MRTGIRLLALMLSFLFVRPGDIAAQVDSFRLVCPLDQAVVVPPPPNAVHYDPPDLCVTLMSKPDTVVKAVSNARVTNTEFDEDGKYGIVIFSRIAGKDYYFWYTGLTRLLVRKNDVLKAGQGLGIINPGEKIEMLMYQFETPVDPSRYLDCKNVLKSD